MQKRNQDHQTNIWFTAEEKADLKALAHRLDTSMAEVIRQGIRLVAEVNR